jgi:ketosteroid isomerase-like protein
MKSASGDTGRAMAQENVRVVEAAYDVLASSGLEEFAERWAEDIEWRAMRGRWRGRQAGLAYMREWLDLFDEFHTEVVELIDAGNDQVVTYLRYSGRLKASGMDVPPEYFAIVMGVHDGKIAHALEYATREEALEAVGMRE